MTSTDTAALLLFRNIKEGIETGRIANVDTVQTEVEAAIAELNRMLLLEGPTHNNDPVRKLFIEIESLHEMTSKYVSQLAEFESCAEALRKETSQIAARAEACNLLAEQQQKEHVKVLAAMEEMKPSVSAAPPPCLVPEPSPTDLGVCHAPSKMAVVSFPGGPRTVTIHPPDSPNYQSIIRDEKGDVIITFKGPKPLRREGAFRGPLEDIDWRKITRVYGRGPEPPRPRAVPPVPRWPDRSQPSSCGRAESHGPSDTIAMQRLLSILAPDYLINAESPSLPTGVSSSSEPSQDSQSSSSAESEVVSIQTSTPPSSSIGRGKKRTRHAEEDEDAAEATETHEEAHPLIDLQTAKEPTTPTPVKREESQPPVGHPKRKKLRSSASREALRTGSLSRSNSALDLTRTV